MEVLYKGEDTLPRLLVLLPMGTMLRSRMILSPFWGLKVPSFMKRTSYGNM